jgi:hypothetical protein
VPPAILMSESTGTGVDDTGSRDRPGRCQPRWPMATAVLAATILYVAMPHRGRVPGWWPFPVLQLVLPGLLITQDPGRIDRRSAGPKLTMLVQSALSLVIAILVIARAINVLPG